MPTVSVIIPLYNKELYVKRAICSVLNQRIQDFEIIVVDDGSTDRSSLIVQDIKDSRIRVVTQKNMGVSSARNRGIKESRANLIAFLDADDEWYPNFLDSILELNEEFPEAGIYATAFEVLDPYGKKITSKKKLKVSSSHKNRTILNYFHLVSLGSYPISSSSVCIPKKVFDDIGQFPIGVSWGEDTYMWGIISLHYPVAYSFEIGAIYHMEALNRTLNNRQSVTVKGHPFVKVAKEFLNNQKIPKEKIEDLREYIALLEITAAIKDLQAGENKEALKILFYCKTKRFYSKKIYRLLLSLVPPTIYLNSRRFRKKLVSLLGS